MAFSQISPQKQNIAIPEIISEANSSRSLPFLGREDGKGQFYKLTKIAIRIFFRSRDQEKKEI